MSVPHIQDSSDLDHDVRQDLAKEWFETLRTRICQTFENIEDSAKEGPCASDPAGRFERKSWKRTDEDGSPGGGGQISMMYGRVFEKVGVNVSTVYGTFSEEFRSKIPGAVENEGKFWACGLSVVAHMRSPLVPAVHMNTRMIVTSSSWFGGGADLTPMIPDDSDAEIFHEALKSCCDRHHPDYYDQFKAWCDGYFYLPHRQEPRGVGGIFFDNLNSGHWDSDFAFVRDVGETFLATYPDIIHRHIHKPWTEEQREHQLHRRGRYVEFNLLYDRGTQFGLKTGGNPEAVLMSMPPTVKWA